MTVKLVCFSDFE